MSPIGPIRGGVTCFTFNDCATVTTDKVDGLDARIDNLEARYPHSPNFEVVTPVNDCECRHPEID